MGKETCGRHGRNFTISLSLLFSISFPWLKRNCIHSWGITFGVWNIFSFAFFLLLLPLHINGILNVTSITTLKGPFFRGESRSLGCGIFSFFPWINLFQEKASILFSCFVLRRIRSDIFWGGCFTAYLTHHIQSRAG
jgi:hypothetical protein